MTESSRPSGDTLQIRRDRDLLRVTLNDPQRANALSPRMISELTSVYRRDWRCEGVRALILDAAGRHFSGGADLDHLRTVREAGPEENRADSQAFRDLFDAVLRQEALTVAMVQGACVAGGCGVATAHDFVVASESARFMYSEVRIGFVAALVASFLPLRLRGADIRRLLLNPEFLSAEQALDIGLVDRIAPEEKLAATADELVGEILQRASSESIARTKRHLLDLIGRRLDDALDRSAEANAAARSSDDCRRGITSFLERKSAPRWRD